MHNDIDRDLYEILGVPKGASQADIKNAYRARARECHPDVARDDPDGEHKFKELTFAYEVLSEPEKRRTYDAMGLEGLKRGAGIDFDGFGSISDLFDVFFGGGFSGGFRRSGSRRGRERGRDVQTVLSVSLREVLTGTEKEIEVSRRATCDECGGSGMKPGTQLSRCGTCNGAGEVRRTHRSMFGTFIRSEPCRGCNGTGEVITEPCGVCAGEGRRQLTDKLQVSVPPGVERGDRLRVKGKGEGGLRGGPDGDLYVLVDVESHPAFEREGARLHTVASVDMVDAALGAEVTVDAVDGEFSLKVPPGTQPGDVIKARGKGLPPRYGGKRSDMIVHMNVDVPRKLSAEKRRILESYRSSGKEKAGR